MAVETREFQTETKKILDMMIHSIYTNKEIFLRELISNASDAIDKLRFAALTESELMDEAEREIYLIPDAASHTLTIADNGIGMTYEEVNDNIGTIAKSGTKAFLEKMQEAGEAQDKDLIGQFGVGFYSAFMVADRVTLLTRSARSDKGVKWQSNGDGTYTIEEADKPTVGTAITLHLTDEFAGGEDDFTQTYRLAELVKKYSDYIRYPIRMNVSHEEPETDADGKIVEGGTTKTVTELRTLNSMQPLWTRAKSDIKPEEYNEFYKNQFHDWTDPLDVIHTKAEGTVEYTALLYIPSKAPFDLYHPDFHSGIQLYSRHVFIMDECKELLPEYLRFVRGLVDSPDFSLNISRELLQQSRELKLIGKNLEKTVLKTLSKTLDKDRTKYESFWAEFGRALKIGVYTDFTAQDKLKDLLLFASSNDKTALTTLKEYVSRMQAEQKSIYYATGKDRATIERLPQMELLAAKNIEVLYLTDNVDEFTLEALREYEGKKFHSISRGDLDLGDLEKEAKEEADTLTKDNDTLLKDIKEALGDKVSDVRISTRLKSGAVCLVSADEGVSLAMEQLLAEAHQPVFKAQRILELNPHHKLFTTLQAIHDGDKDTFGEYCSMLYDQALLIEGILPTDPIEFASRVAKLMAR